MCVCMCVYVCVCVCVCMHYFIHCFSMCLCVCVLHACIQKGRIQYARGAFGICKKAFFCMSEVLVAFKKIPRHEKALFGHTLQALLSFEKLVGHEKQFCFRKRPTKYSKTVRRLTELFKQRLGFCMLSNRPLYSFICLDNSNV